MSERPAELDGAWPADPAPDHHAYQYYRAGPVAVRFQDHFEPDGELVTTEPMIVHIEQMDENHWWIGLDSMAGEHIAIDFHARGRIRVMWRDER